jgi:tRNA pseudouridine55 synthase
MNRSTIDGILNINKPAGRSSARVVSLIKRLLARKTKVGHAGTLDPFATGVLLILIGKATKRCESLMAEPKQYDATLKLGFTTSTFDPESAEVRWPGAVVSPPDLNRIQEVLNSFTGTIQQAPPSFSAMKVGGRRAYDLARKGHEVILPPRPVRIDSIELVEYSFPRLRIRVDCGRGTYIRSLARDIGEALDTGAYLTALERTRVGPYAIDNAIAPDALTPENVVRHLL